MNFEKNKYNGLETVRSIINIFMWLAILIEIVAVAGACTTGDMIIMGGAALGGLFAVCLTWLGGMAGKDSITLWINLENDAAETTWLLRQIANK